MKRRFLLFLLPLSLFLGACSTALIPSAHAPAASVRAAVPDRMENLRKNWEKLWRNDVPDEEKKAALRAYNADLLTMIRLWRYDVTERNSPPDYIEIEYAKGFSLRDITEVYDDVVPSVDVKARTLSKHYTNPGLGVPMAGVIPAEAVELTDQHFHVKTRGTVSNLTAVLEFPKVGKPKLHFLLRQRQEEYRYAGYSIPLTGNFSAPMELYWDLTRLNKDRYLGLLRPQKLRDTTGLSTMESYAPNKIPVVLTHGLASSAGTFDELVNRLTADPDIRRRYQFWYFNYPSGLAWTRTARMCREAIADARNRLDPQHRNKNWDNMVIMGHSMGGVITHYNQCVDPQKMLEVMEEDMPALKEAETQEEALAMLGGLRGDYDFKPVKAGMVVYMAAPHRGSPIAAFSITSLITSLVELPKNLLDEVVNVATLQEDMLIANPERLTEWFTSIKQLSPRGYSIRGLQRLQVQGGVETHSVIGNQGSSRPLEKTSDGVVPYWSSHVNWGTEDIVDSGHNVQDQEETAEILIRFLKAYAAKHPEKS